MGADRTGYVSVCHVLPQRPMQAEADCARLAMRQQRRKLGNRKQTGWIEEPFLEADACVVTVPMTQPRYGVGRGRRIHAGISPYQPPGRHGGDQGGHEKHHEQNGQFPTHGIAGVMYPHPHVRQRNEQPHRRKILAASDMAARLAPHNQPKSTNILVHPLGVAICRYISTTTDKTQPQRFLRHPMQQSNRLIRPRITH